MPTFNNGKIAVRPRQGKIHSSDLDTIVGVGDTYLHSEASRKTEEHGLDRLTPVPELDELQREVMLLERIGRDPKNYRTDYPVRDRPERPIYGSALWAWIGRQPGITMRAKEVEAMLDRISEIEQRRSKLGRA